MFKVNNKDTRPTSLTLAFGLTKLSIQWRKKRMFHKTCSFYLIIIHLVSIKLQCQKSQLSPKIENTKYCENNCINLSHNK